MLTCASCGQENPDAFHFCGSCGAVLAPALTRQVRKTVTVVFADVTGSTALGEQLDPESFRSVMARYFDTARICIERHGGTVEKFIGDAVMAVFAVPTVHEDDALRGVRAAAELRDALAPLNAELERDYGVSLLIRTGINSGEVVAGTDERLATGDAVNVAARLEQAARPGEILIGEQTYALARGAIDVEPVTPLSLKGKAHVVPAYRLLRVVEGAAAFERRLDTPLVGRHEQLARLRAAFAAAVSERCCRLVTVLGPPGIGKPRLATGLAATLAAEADVLSGSCLPYGRESRIGHLSRSFALRQRRRSSAPPSLRARRKRSSGRCERHSSDARGAAPSHSSSRTSTGPNRRFSICSSISSTGRATHPFSSSVSRDPREHRGRRGTHRRQLNLSGRSVDQA